jgi:WD40 repeat protein
MLNSRTLWTIVAVAVLVGLLSICADAQRLFVDSAYPNNAIWRFNADLSPAPTAGNPYAVMSNFGDVSQLTSQYKCFAVGPNDNYIYATAYYDYGAYQWGPGCEYVTRYDRTTGLKDNNWKVWLRGDTQANHGSALAFAPDGRLYASEINFGGVHLVDIANQTSMNVLNDFSTYADGLTFDSAGNAYVSARSEGVVRKYSVSGTTWTRDLSYNGDVPGSPFGLAFGSDGWLYSGTSSGGYMYRLDSAGVVDPNWTTQAITGYSMDMAFGPDGKLYVNGLWRVLTLDVATKSWDIVCYPGGTYYGQGIAWETVPEPGSLLALCMGVGSFALLRRRK